MICELEKDKVYLGNNTEVLNAFPNNCIDLTVTSPPYDNLRKDAYVSSVDYKSLIKQLFRVTKPGGVVVWVVGDATIDGSESLSSFRQAILFHDNFFNVHDTMIYLKNSFAFPSNNRYHQVFEYMFVFSKGKPKTFNPIKDRENKYGIPWGKATARQKDGTLKERKQITEYKEFGARTNVWRYNVGAGFGQQKNSLAYKHPASFPLQLAKDHIISWSNEEEDVVLDPFCGSGTTLVAAKQLNRRFIGIDISEEYVNLTKQRLLEES